MKPSLDRLRVAGFWEAISFLVLLGVAMPLKYLAGWPPAVRMVSLLHGTLFLLYIILALLAAREHRWTWQRTALVPGRVFKPMRLHFAERWEGLYAPTQGVRQNLSGHKAPPTGFENTP